MPSYEIVDWVAVVLVHTQIVASVDNSHTHTYLVIKDTQLG